MQSRFRLRGKHLFLTYAQCPIVPDAVLAQLKDRVRPLEITKYLVSQEKHKDGKDHIHAYLLLNKAIDTTDEHKLDLVQPDDAGMDVIYHGNYQVCRSPEACWRYVGKDGIYITNMEKKPAAMNKALIAKSIIDNRQTLSELLEDHPQLLFGYKKLKLDIIEMQNDKYVPAIRQVKAYWYYGATRLGKSWKGLLDHTPLMLEYDMATKQPRLGGSVESIYFKNSQNKWFDGYTGQRFLFIDELPIESAKWILNYVKQWTDKIPLQPEIKGARIWARWDTVIITCQHSIDTFFADVSREDLAAIHARFQQVHITVKQY